MTQPISNEAVEAAKWEKLISEVGNACRAIAVMKEEFQNIVNCDLDGVRKDFGDDTDRQFRLWAQNRAKAALSNLPAAAEDQTNSSTSSV